MYFLWPLIALCYCGRQECRNRWHPAWHQPVSCTEPSVYIAYVIFPFCLFPKQKAPADSPMLIVTFIQTFLLFCFIAWYAQRIQQRFKGILPVKTRIRQPPPFPAASLQDHGNNRLSTWLSVLKYYIPAPAVFLRRRAGIFSGGFRGIRSCCGFSALKARP